MAKLGVLQYPFARPRSRHQVQFYGKAASMGGEPFEIGLHRVFGASLSQKLASIIWAYLQFFKCRDGNSAARRIRKPTHIEQATENTKIELAGDGLQNDPG